MLFQERCLAFALAMAAPGLIGNRGRKTANVCDKHGKETTRNIATHFTRLLSSFFSGNRSTKFPHRSSASQANGVRVRCDTNKTTGRQQVVAAAVAVWDDVRIVLEKFANRLTGSEYFQWVRRLRRTSASQRQAQKITLRFVGPARTISKESMSIFRWGN
jgi:hypothetical protein